MDPYQTYSPGFSAPGSPGSLTAGSFSPMDSPSPQRGRSRPSTNDKEAYGLNLGMLRKWHREKKDEMLSSEQAKQEIAVSKVRGFLDAVGCVVRIQSWWRMMKPYHAFLALKRAQKATKAVYYRALRLYWKSERLFRVQIFGKFFLGWREEARTSKKLKSLITQFFKICIQRLRLTPQACMAFFNPGEWSRAVAKEDMLKIRRLMLEKLFHGWRSETVFLRMVRYKASQILSRTVRRTKGPLWVKESTLVCFHMWFRYIQVKKAYRHDLPDPRYTNPMLPQWTKLMKDITVNRIKRKRTRELGMQLTQLRSFKRWKRLMTVDRTKPVTPLAVAIMHYSTVLMTKVLHLWHGVIRERGKMMRFRTKIFQSWRKWAPKHKQMRIFNDKAQELIRLKLVQRAYGVMIKLCFNVIGTRTERIKELRRNFCDRRVVICAYALLHKDSHVMMVDCWRRLYFYWKSRRNWKSVTWHYTYEWHAHKMKVIFHAWRSLTQPTAALPSALFGKPHTTTTPHKTPHATSHTTHGTNATILTLHPPSTTASVASSANTSVRSHNPYISETESESTTPRGTLSRADSNHSVMSVDTVSTIGDDVGVLYSRSKVPALGVGGGIGSVGSGSQPGSAVNSARDDSGSSPLRSTSGRRSSFRGKVMFTSPYHPRGMLASKEINYEKLVRDFVPKGLSIVQKGLEGKLGTKMSSLQFRTFCTALSRSYAMLGNRLTSSSGGVGVVSGVGSAGSVSASVSAANSVAGGATPTTPSATFLTNPTNTNPTTNTTTNTNNNAPPVYARVAAPNALITFSTTSTNTTQIGPSADRGSTTDTTLSSELHYPVHLYFNRTLQEKLQNAIDEVDMVLVLQAVSEGAVIETQHLRQIGLHIGDQYMQLYTLLLTNSVQFFADRVMKQDSTHILMEIQNPILAFLTGSQIERWNRHDITYRECMHMTENLPTQRYLSGEFASYYLMRFIILKNIDLKAKRLLHLCVMLPPDRTVDQEVPEVLKRQKLAKLYRLRKSLTEMIGGDDSFQETYLHAISNIPPLVRPENRPVTPLYARTNDNANKDIYTVLREFTLLTGKLTTEARSLRQPLMQRDDRLIANGFLRGARADYLALKESCLTPAQRAEIAEKAAKQAEKERKLAEKAKLKERKKRDKANGVSSKKGKKNKHNTGPTDLNFDTMDNESSGDESFTDNNSGSGGNSEYAKLTFLEGGLAIGEQADLHHEVDFMTRTSHHKHPVYIEVYQRPNWREMSSVRGAIQQCMTVCVRSSIKRVIDVLQADKTIGTIDYTTIRNKYNSIGAYIVNHVLANVPCRRSSTWYVLPKEYWSFKTVRERVNVEIALADATVHSIRTQLNTDHHDHYYINNDIAKYQKFLKQTRKEILTIAEKRANKSSADVEERAPFVGGIKKCDVKIKGAEKAIEVIRDKLRRAELQVATGNATNAAEIFIPPPVPEEPKKGKKAPEVVRVMYDFKTVYELIDAANSEIQSLKGVISEQSARKKEAENSVRMYDWQCQRTSRMLRDLAETRFQTMVDVQLIAVREAKRLDHTQDHQDAQSVRYKRMKRYTRQLVDFLEGPIADRAAQLTREAEMRRVSELMNRSPANHNSSGHNLMSSSGSGRAEFASKDAALSAAREAGAKKRGLLSSSFTEEMSPVPSFRSALSNLSDTDLERPTTGFSELFSGGVLDENSVDESNYSYENDDLSLTLERSIRHTIDTADTADSNEITDTRTSSQIAVDRELELAHFNSAENRIKRENELKLLAEEQAREMASTDLRIRVFEEYWTALPQNMERVQRKKNKEVEEVVASEESSVVAEVEVANEHLTRTQRTWKSIGTQYWRSKEALVTELVQTGQEISDLHLKFRAIDPLDEDLNEITPLPIMTGVDNESFTPYVEHAGEVNKLHNTSVELWKSTAQADHQSMLSVSMKEVNETEEVHKEVHHREEGGGGGGGMGRQGSEGTISRQPSTGVSRQPSSVSRQHSDVSQHTTHTTHTTHTNQTSATANRAVKPVKPDPFALAARDEHIRFVDKRMALLHTSDGGDSEVSSIKPIGSFDTQHESELLHAEIGVLVTKHHHLPTLVENKQFVTPGEGGTDPTNTNTNTNNPHNLSTITDENEEEEESYDFQSASKSFLKFNESLGIAPPTPEGSGGVMFERFDKIFDKLSTSIVGALEEAFPTGDESAISEPTVLSNSSKVNTIEAKEKRKRRGTLVLNPADSVDLHLHAAIEGVINDPHNITTSATNIDTITSTTNATTGTTGTSNTPAPLLHSHSTTSSTSSHSKAAKHDTDTKRALRDKAVSFIDKTKTTVSGTPKSKNTRARSAHSPKKGANASGSVASSTVDSDSDVSVDNINTSNTKPPTPSKGRKGSVATPKKGSVGSGRHTVVTPTRGARGSVSPIDSAASSTDNTPRTIGTSAKVGTLSRSNTPTRRNTTTPIRSAHTPTRATHIANTSTSKPNTPIRHSSPSHSMVKIASGRATPNRSRSNTLTSNNSTASASNKNYGIEEGSETSTHTPPPLELSASRRASRARVLEFSDELLPSGRDPLDDDVTSELSMEVYNSEQGIVDMPRVPGLFPSGDSAKSAYTSSSKQPSPLNSPRSPQEGGLRGGVRGSVSGSPGGMPAPFERSNTFKVSVDKLMETMSLEPQMPEHYLPEKEMREAIFGDHLDTGGAGLVAFLQSFASSDASEAPVKKVKKPISVEVDKGFVAVPIAGEWVLKPSVVENKLYSPKMGAFTPKASDVVRGGQYASPTQVLSVPKEVPQSFILEGTGLGSPAKPDTDVMSVPALSPGNSRRLAQKLGFDQSALHPTTTNIYHNNLYSTTDTTNPDLLSMVQEFYVEKQVEAEKLAKLEEKAVISYFPANFRQNKERAKEDLFQGSGFGEYDDSADVDDVYNNNVMYNEHGGGGYGVSTKSTGSNVGIRSSMSREGEQTRRASMRNSAEFTHADIAAAVAAVGGSNGRSFANNVSSKTTTSVNSYAPVVVPTASMKHTPYVVTTTTTTTHPTSTSTAQPHPTITHTTTTTAPNVTTQHLSVKMQEMLSRRGSYNPAEIRLELLQSIHDDQSVDNQLDYEVSSAVREVKKYLHDREEEAHRVPPTGRLRTKESFAQAYREAVQGQPNPYKQLAVARTVQIQHESEMMHSMLLSRRNTASTVDGELAHINSSHTTNNATHNATATNNANTTNTLPANERRDSDLLLTDPHNEVYTQAQYSDPYSYVNRAGTPEFWVDVAKIAPTNNTNRGDDSVSGVDSGTSSVGEERRVVFMDTHDTHNTNTQYNAPKPDYTYGQESVLGYVNDVPSTNTNTKPSKPLALSIDAVKLPHPVSSAVDPKTVGQYNLYRPRSPLRSPPRSRDGKRIDTNNTSKGGVSKKKGMVYSHSDGSLLAPNTIITGTKMHLTTHIDNSDDYTTTSDTFLSPIEFNISHKPLSPPALSAVPFFGSLDSGDEGGVMGSAGGGVGGSRWRLDTTSVVVEGRAVETAERPPRTPSRLSRMNSRDVIVSGVNTNPTSQPNSPNTSTSRGKPIVLPTTFVLPEPAFADTHNTGNNTNTSTTNNSEVARDYRASVSAAKIISEIAGDNYVFGMGIQGILSTRNSMSNSVVDDSLVIGGALESVDVLSADNIPTTTITNTSTHTASTRTIDIPMTDYIPDFNLSPAASPVAMQTKHKKVATKTTNLVFSPDSIGTRNTNNGTNTNNGNASFDNQSVNSNSTFSFNLVESETDLYGERLKLPKVHTNTNTTTTNATNTTSNKERRTHDAPLDTLVVVPQTMPGLAKINDLIVQKAGNLKTVGPVSKAAQQAIQAQQKKQNKNVSYLRNLSTEGVLGSAMSDLDSVPSHHESMNMPVPVSRVEITHTTSTTAPQIVDEALIEAQIEAELRQMLHKAHNEDAAEAYRQQYYRLNKEHLSNAGVAMHEESNIAVPFVAGSKGRGNNTNVSALTSALNTSQRMQMSSSVGGGGFSGRGNGVLHKVKGSGISGSASTTQLPPLDTTLLLNVETKFSDPSTKTPKPANKTGKNTKFVVTEEILQKRQILSALLNHTTAETYELDRPLDPGTYVTGTASSKTKVGVDTLQASKSSKLFSAGKSSIGNTSGMGGSSVEKKAPSGGGQLLLTRHGSRKGSMDSISSMGSGPLQSIHAPAIEISSHTTAYSKGRK